MTQPAGPAQPFAQHPWLADHHEGGVMAEQVMELLARADPVGFTMSGATERS
jgi:hypothetical protein